MPIHRSPPGQIATPRLILRRPGPTDAAAIFSEYAQDAEVTRYMTWQPHQSIRETEEFLAGCAERWKSQTEYSWSITLKADDHAVGMISARPSAHGVEIGYVLCLRLWNQRIMSEAFAAIIDWFWQQEGNHRIWATCDIDNPASARVMEKAGMQREGILRRWIIHPNISGEPRDCFVYAKVRAKE